MNRLILLTIAIPTWNRAEYLRQNLCQLKAEIGDKVDEVELLISDNFSTDSTPSVVADAISRGMKINYIRNSENIGSDHNIAQCFNQAAGEYVLILGDDDLLVDGALSKVLAVLTRKSYGVVFLKPYGYDEDFRAEQPACRTSNQEFSNPSAFIAKIGALAGLISSNVINKKILLGENADQYCGTNLVQTYLIYDAAIRVGHNYIVNEYLVAYKRNNWGYYPFTQVFVDRFWSVVDYFSQRGLEQASINKLKRNMLVGYYPFYIFKMRLKNAEKMSDDYLRFKGRFGDNFWFWLTIAPQFKLPRYLALAWGGGVVLVGRIVMGDANRGISFVQSWLVRVLRKK